MAMNEDRGQCWHIRTRSTSTRSVQLDAAILRSACIAPALEPGVQHFTISDAILTALQRAGPMGAEKIADVIDHGLRLHDSQQLREQCLVFRFRCWARWKSALGDCLTAVDWCQSGWGINFTARLSALMRSLRARLKSLPSATGAGLTWSRRGGRSP